MRRFMTRARGAFRGAPVRAESAVATVEESVGRRRFLAVGAAAGGAAVAPLLVRVSEARAADDPYARLDTAQTFTAPQTIQTGSAASHVPLTVQRSSGEGELAQVKDAGGRTFIDFTNDSSAYFGYTGVAVNKPDGDRPGAYAPGYTLAVAGVPKYTYGLDTHDVDLCLAFSYGRDGPAGDMLRISPNGQMWFGTAIGSPTLRDAVFSLSNKQGQPWGMTILAPDDPTKSSHGIQLHQRGNTVSLGLYQDDGTRTTMIQMGGHSISTDRGHAGTADFAIHADAAGGAQRYYLSPGGGHYFGSSNLAADATDGFVNIPYIAGTPTGNPALRGGTAPIGINGGRLWLWDGRWYATARTNGANTFTATQTFADGSNLAFGTGAGTQIGTSAAQKIGFFNATPVAQPSLTYSRSGAGETPAVAALRTTLASLGLVADRTRA
jgi:hypothetical protein